MQTESSNLTLSMIVENDLTAEPSSFHNPEVASTTFDNKNR